MGGPGSGRQKDRQRRTVETCRELDANQMSAAGYLQSNLLGSSYYWPDGNASISVRAEDDRNGFGRLYLSYRVLVAGNSDGEEWEDVAETIPIIHAPCRLGGSRAYFICPGDGVAGCGRRTAKLYLVHRHFLCRQCSRLVYASPYEYPWQRAARRANKLRQRLAIGGIDAPLPEKPRWMPVSTYARLLDEVLQAEIAADEAYTEWLQRFVARSGNRHLDESHLDESPTEWSSG
jgi:hypothetical protein